MYANRYGTQSAMERARVHLNAASDALDRRQDRVPSIATLIRSMLAADSSIPRSVREAEAAAEWSRSDTNTAQRDADDCLRGGLASRPGRRDAATVDFEWLAREVRGMSESPGSAGGFAIGTDHLDPAAALFADSAIGGCTIVSGLQGDVLIPRNTAQLTASWLVPGASPSTVTPTLGSVSMTPRAILCTVDVSIPLVRQAPGGRDFIGSMVAQAVLAGIEKAVFQGTGSEQPLGLANIAAAAGITELSGTALTWATAVSAQRTLLAANVPDTRLAWVAGPTARETLQQRVRAASTAEFLWQRGTLADVPAIASPHAPTASAYLGDWSQVIVAFWGNGIELRVDPSAGFNTGSVAVQCLALVDVALRQPSAFVRIASIT